MRVAVLGVGLAGVSAALAARAAGATVTIIGDRPGASAMWSGVAEVYGPIYDQVDHQDRLGRPHLVAVGQPPLEDRGARLARLLRRRSFHPFARLDLTPSDLTTLVERAADTLAVGLVWADGPTYVANAHGTARLADGAWPSVALGALAAECRLAVIGFEHFPLFSPEAAAAALEVQGLRARAAWVEVAGASLAQSPALASTRLEALGDGELAALGAAIAKAADGPVALLPPVLGRGLEQHARVLQGLRAGAGATVIAEVASTHRSLHGFRLHESLSTRLEAAGVQRERREARGVRVEGGAVKALALDGGESLEVDRLVLATGRTLSGGIAREGPLREAVLGLPLFLEGAPVEGGQCLPDLATRRLFEDHPLFRLGLGVATDLRPLGANARPAFSNVWAAGLVLGGTDFTRDGSAFGVGLVTGYVAGRHAAGVEA